MLMPDLDASPKGINPMATQKRSTEPTPPDTPGGEDSGHVVGMLDFDGDDDEDDDDEDGDSDGDEDRPRKKRRMTLSSRSEAPRSRGKYTQVWTPLSII